MSRTPHVVKIEEAHCIGCNKCVSVCPVDAIVGANKHMHSVLTDLCIGCDLCLPPCPVDCITLIPVSLTPEERKAKAVTTKKQYQAKKQRLARQAEQKRLADLEASAAYNSTYSVLDAVARAKQKRKIFKY